MASSCRETILRTLGGGEASVEDYNDIRVYVGVEWKPCDGLSGISGHLEIGYVFDRELVFRDEGEFKPTDTLMIRASLAR